MEIYKNIFSKSIEFDDEIKVVAYLIAGFLASQLGEYDNSFSYLNQSLQLSLKLNKKILIAESLNNLGNLFYIKNEIFLSVPFPA